MPRADESAAIRVAGDVAEHWQQGVYDVWHLRGNCRVQQGETDIRGPEAVLWIDRGDPDTLGEPKKVLAYFEGGPQQVVTLDHTATKTNPRGDRLETPSWFGRLITQGSVDLETPSPKPSEAGSRRHRSSSVVWRDSARSRTSRICRLGPHRPLNRRSSPRPCRRRRPLVPVGAAPFRKFRVLQRSDVGFQFKTLKSPAGEDIVVVSGGVNVIIEGLSVEGLPASLGPLGTVDIETDRAVVWTQLPGGGNVNEVTQQNDAPLEIYMEGNIVFRQGDRTVYADRMFYDARRQVGTILNAELLAPPPAVAGYQYQGLVRLKAAAMRQLDASRFVASDALLTTSRLEDPAYSFESQTITLTDRQQPLVDPYTGAMGVNPATGEPAFAHQYNVESQSNFLYVSGVPVFYWPTIATTLEKPTFYVNNVRVRNDSIFGFQTLFDLDAFQLLGYEAPQGVEWDLNLDYLSKRGLGFGTSVDYDRDSFFDLAGPTARPRRRLVHQRPRARQPRPRPSRHRSGKEFPRPVVLEPSAKTRRRDARRLDRAGRSGLAQRPDLPGGILRERMGREQGPNDRHTAEARVRQHVALGRGERADQRFLHRDAVAAARRFLLARRVAVRQPDDTLLAHFAAYANIGIATPPTNPTLLSQWTLLPWEVDSLGNPTMRPRASGSSRATSSTTRSTSRRSRSCPTFWGNMAIGAPI